MKPSAAGLAASDICPIIEVKFRILWKWTTDEIMQEILWYTQIFKTNDSKLKIINIFWDACGSSLFCQCSVVLIGQFWFPHTLMYGVQTLKAITAFYSINQIESVRIELRE